MATIQGTTSPKCTHGGCDQEAKWLLLEGSLDGIPDNRCADVASDCLCTHHWASLRNADPDEAYRYTPAHVVLPQHRSNDASF
jgi:hypothetical protein